MRLCVLFVPLALCAGAAPAQEAVQRSAVEARGVAVPIEVREQYLGRTGEKTAVRFVLSVSREELRARDGLTPRVYSFFLAAEVKDARGEVVERFREPLDVDLSVAAAGPLEVSFLRALPPGPLEVQLRLEGVAGTAVAMRALSLNVPAMSSEFRAEDAGALTASAVLLEAENRPAVPKGATGLIRFLPPSKEVPVGLLRIEVEAQPPIQRVEFRVGDKKILTRNRPPYTVELDLGTIPRKQTLTALGYDAQGNFVDMDAWAINEREAQLAVRLLELPRRAADGSLEVKVAVQSIGGSAARSVKLFVDNEKVKEWAGPPYTFTVPAAKLKGATLIRASALDGEGKEYGDVKLLKGDSRFLASVEVRLVELNVSVSDAEGRFARGLKKEDFTVLEDGARQEVSAFSFSESLPLSLGIVVDGSGSMQSSLPIVKQAATDFVTKLIGEKDQAFVIEFRESPTLLAPMTSRHAALVRAVSELRAAGATALYDSIVLGLYQFRAVPGKKAIVVLTDGKDNHSSTEWETLRRYARTAGIPIWFIGLDLSVFDVSLKARLKDLAADTGGETFFIGNVKQLPEVYERIQTELRSQYFLTYLASSTKPEDQYRTIAVKLADPKLRVRTIRGYFP